MKRLSKVAAVLLVASVAVAQTETTTTHKKHKHVVRHSESTTAQIDALKAQMQEQQEQIDQMKSKLADRDEQLSTAQQQTAAAAQQAADATTKADAASSSSQQSAQQVTALEGQVNDLKTANTGLQQTVASTEKRIATEVESPASLHYKGVTITPVAFFAFEGVWRQRSTNSGLATPFNSIPFPAANQGHVSELNFSGRQSRIGGLFQGNAGNFKLSGYIEADFLSAGVTSNNNQSNSYTLRQRQFWGQAATAGGFKVTGGQMWSLVTETGLSTDARTEKLPNNIDPNYNIGFSWMRQPGIRVQQSFGDVKTGMATVALSLEQAQIHGVTAGSSVSGAVPNNYFFGGSGNGGGLYDSTATYANNAAPDMVVKGTLDYPHAHFELGGLARFFRDYYYPITSATGTAAAPVYTYSTKQTSDTKVGGGVFASARVTVNPFLTLALQGMAGQGVGRYGAAQLDDATIRPDGTLEPIRNYHGLLTIETHPTKKLDIYAYYGGEYNQRTVYTTPQGNLIGYGPQDLNDGGCYNLPAKPSSSGFTGSDSASGCSSPTRYIQEPMIGFTYRVVNSPKYGRLQYAATYQFIQRNLWSGVGSSTTPSGPRAENSMIHVQMRYYIP